MSDEPPKRLAVLILDDNRADAELVQMILGGIMNLRHVERLSAAIKECARFKADHKDGYDCALVDLHLPDANEAEAIHRLRIDAPEVPIVVITGAAEEYVKLVCRAAGAHGFIAKADLDVSSDAAEANAVARMVETISDAVRAHRVEADAIKLIREQSADKNRIVDSALATARRASIEAAQAVESGDLEPVNQWDDRTPMHVKEGRQRVASATVQATVVQTDLLEMLIVESRAKAERDAQQAARIDTIALSLNELKLGVTGGSRREIGMLYRLDELVRAEAARAAAEKEAKADKKAIGVEDRRGSYALAVAGMGAVVSLATLGVNMWLRFHG